MSSNRNTWVTILAGGEGRRLHSLTKTRTGTVVPKQYCSLRGGPPLLQEALQRAQHLAPTERICAVVAAQQRHWWQPILSSLAPNNVLEEPASRGTAIGTLLALLHIAKHDPQAELILLPADHYVDDEPTLLHALHEAVAHLRVHPEQVLLLGMEPEEPDPELGYVLPGAVGSNNTYRVAKFVEKPTRAVAAELIGNGAMWNAFIVVTKVSALLALFEQAYPEIVSEMRGIVLHQPQTGVDAMVMTDLYRRLPCLDFSQHLLNHRSAGSLRLFPIPSCGWSDLGTPKRVIDTLRRMSERERIQQKMLNTMPPIILAEQCERIYHLG